MKLSLRMCLERYDRTAALIDGLVRPEKIQSEITTLPSSERHRAFLERNEFEAAELSMSSYLMARTRGREVTAIPVFPRRLFPHSFIYVNEKAGVNDPRDLVGKRVGVGMYQVTMSLLCKGFLQHEFDIHPEEITWVTAREELIPFEKPEGLKIERAANDKELHRMLRQGEIAAEIYPDVDPLEQGGRHVRRLFKDFKSEEIEYYSMTHIFPIMHVIVVRDEILKKNPWVASSLHNAFVKSKRICYEFLKHPSNSSLVWSRDLLEEQEGVIGSDPFAYGIEENVSAVEQLIQYSSEQGLIDHSPRPSELFATLD